MIHESLLQDLSLWGCLWQSMAFIALGLVARYLLRHRPSRAYQILLFAMMAAALVPLMSAVVKHFDLGVFTAETTESLGAPLEGLEAISLAGTDDLAGIAVPTAVSPAGINSGPAETTFAWHSISWQVVAIYGWMIATLALLARLIVTFMYGAYIVRNARRSGREQVQRAIDDVTLKLRLSCGLQVRGSRRIRSPIVWCWSRPSILLVPDACGDPKVDWTGVVAHELAHCKRWDHITGLMAELMVCLLPWNPIMWLSKKCLVRLGEQACDDWVVATGQPSEDYAESLIRFRPQRQMAFLPAVVHSKKGLASRIDRILKDNCGNPRTGAAWALAVSIVAVCLTVGVALAQTRPAEPAGSEAQEKPPATSLCKAAEEGDVEEVKRLIAQGANVNSRDANGYTPLHNAIRYPNRTIISLLLGDGANINAKNSQGMTPLNFSIMMNEATLAEFFIDEGAEVNAADIDGQTLLHWAIMTGNRKLVGLLIDRGASIQAKDNKGWTALHHAAQYGWNKCVTLLLDKGADINATDKQNETALDIAALGMGGGVAKMLLLRGANVTSLHAAACVGDIERVKNYFATNADVNARASNGSTPLHAAASGGHLDVVQLLITEGADINAITEEGATPLNSAAYAGHENVVEELIRKGAQINGSVNNRWTPLQDAARAGHKDVVAILLANGADIQAKNRHRITPLRLAAAIGYQDVAELLLSKGANINFADRNGWTPLHWATREGHRAIVELLVAKGADINPKDKEGRTPLDIAANRGHTEIVELLRRHRAKE